MVTWINAQLAKDKNASAVEVYEVYNNTLFEEKCKGGASLCAIVFLPLVENTQAEGRNNLIKTLKDIQKVFVKRNLDTQIIWIGAQTQPELENVFQIDNNYPSLVIVSSTKDVYTKYLGTLNEKDITDFVWQMKNRPKGVIEFKPVKLAQNVKWDGKDVVIEEEEIDEDLLKEIMNDTKKDL